MKIQCPCGAKYEIDVTPGMQPVQFVCPNCGQDYSAFVNDLIRRELGEGIPVATLAVPPTPTPAASVPSPPPPTGSRLKISTAHAATPPVAVPLPGSQIPRRRNPDELFATEKKFWRKMAWIFWTTAVIAVGGIGGWTWYAWFGSVPHTIFSTRFDDISNSGTTFIVSNQIVFLHGGTLARYDLKTQKQIWSLDLVTKQQIADMMKRADDAQAKYEAEYGKPEYSHYEMAGMREKHTRISLEEALSLHVVGKNVWVAGEDALTHYNWDSGKVSQQIALTNGFGEFTEQGDELVMPGETGVTRVNLVTGDVQTTAIAGLVANAGAGKKSKSSQGGGLPVTPYGDASQPIDAQKANEQAQHLTPAARAALPALIAGNLHQQQIYKEIESDNGTPRAKNSAAPPAPEENFALVPDGDSSLQFGTKLVEAHTEEHEAMKSPPQKSALDSGNVSVMNEGDAINQQLNEIQRTTGSSTVTEDASIYQVTVRNPDSPDAAFTTNIVGQPQLFALKTVNVVTGSKTVIVLDKSNKKLWQADLAYNLPAGHGALGDERNLGQGPCVERDGTLYIFDAATLSAFDISSGNARWRLPSVGISGLFFDDAGMIYLSTSTASLDAVKYSKQIDINNPTQGVLMKIDPQSGKTLWSMKPRGSLAYMEGKYIYTFYEFDPGDEDEQNDPSGIFQPAFLCITRINPRNGNVMWEHTQARAPVDVKFDRNTIQLVFKKEVQVLHYLSF